MGLDAAAFCFDALRLGRYLALRTAAVLGVAATGARELGHVTGGVPCGGAGPNALASVCPHAPANERACAALPLCKRCVALPERVVGACLHLAHAPLGLSTLPPDAPKLVRPAATSPTRPRRGTVEPLALL